MRPNPLLPGLLIGALLVVAAALPVAGQQDDDRPPPRQFPRATVAGLASELSDPAVNDLVLKATTDATREIGAKAPRLLTLPPENVVQAARDFGDEDFELDLVVVSGVPAADTIAVAREYPNTVYVGVDQGLPCVSPDGIPDPSGLCQGQAAALVRNYASSEFAIDQAGYLAGIVAALVSRNGRIGAIGGWPECGDCNRYIEGFERGVQSVAPSATVEVAYLTDAHPEVANLDTETGRAFAEAFIDLKQVDVVLAASGGSSAGVIQAACDAGILAIGTDLDRAQTHPRLGRCTVTSAMRDYAGSIADGVYEMSRAFREERPFEGGGTVFDLGNGGVSLAPFRDFESSLPVGVSTRLQEATNAILAGTIETCGAACGDPGDPDDEPADEQDPSASPTAEEVSA